MCHMIPKSGKGSIHDGLYLVKLVMTEIEAVVQAIVHFIYETLIYHAVLIIDKNIVRDVVKFNPFNKFN